jgi:hypothetical protein
MTNAEDCALIGKLATTQGDRIGCGLLGVVVS